MVFFEKSDEALIQENTVDIKHIQELIVQSDVANVRFSCHDNPQTHIVLETYENGPELEVYLSNEQLKVVTKFPSKRSWIRVKRTIQLTIYLPRDFAERYEISSSAGNINLADLTTKQIKLMTGAGEVKVANIKADELTVESGAGNMKLTEIRASHLLAKSGAGNIYGKDCKGNITASSGAGNISFHLDGEDDIVMKSGAGNINIYFKDVHALDATLKFNTGFGKVRSDLPIVIDTEGKSPQVLGNGEKEFHFKTGVGNINLYRDES